jgi:hypothetical protein
LQRSNALPESLLTDLDGVLERVESRSEGSARDKKLTAELKALVKAVQGSSNAAATARSREGLAATLRGLAG